MVRKHVMAITYQPKIEAVRNGKCTQTIRMTDKFIVGDSILLHGWAGRPYRSKWTWIKRVTVSEVINVQIDFGLGIKVFCPNNVYFNWFDWDSPEADELAALDFIDPPHGYELREVLFGFRPDLQPICKQYQIIRW